MNVSSLQGKTFVKGDPILEQPPSYTVPEGKVLILHDKDAPAAKVSGKTWVHWVQSAKENLLSYYPPSPPFGKHIYKYVLVDEGSYTAPEKDQRIAPIPQGTEIASFTVTSNQTGAGVKETTRIDMAAPKEYHATMKSLLGWAKSELEHVGRIAAIENSDIQYSYALSTVNGMAHLKDALYELVQETTHEDNKRDLLRLHDQVIRVMKHLIRVYSIDLEPIRAFNVKGVLSDLSYLDGATENTGTMEAAEENLNAMNLNSNGPMSSNVPFENENSFGWENENIGNTGNKKKGGKRRRTVRKGRKGRKTYKK